MTDDRRIVAFADGEQITFNLPAQSRTQNVVGVIRRYLLLGFGIPGCALVWGMLSVKTAATAALNAVQPHPAPGLIIRQAQVWFAVQLANCPRPVLHMLMRRQVGRCSQMVAALNQKGFASRFPSEIARANDA